MAPSDENKEPMISVRDRRMPLWAYRLVFPMVFLVIPFVLAVLLPRHISTLRGVAIQLLPFLSGVAVTWAFTFGPR